MPTPPSSIGEALQLLEASLGHEWPSNLGGQLRDCQLPPSIDDYIVIVATDNLSYLSI